jgi:hypothetical protein
MELLPLKYIFHFMQGIKLSVGDITTSVPNARESRYEDQSIKRVLRHKQGMNHIYILIIKGCFFSPHNRCSFGHHVVICVLDT